MSARPRLRKGEGPQLRREILDATTDLLAELGSMDLVSIRAIANRVGVSPPSIYLHFRDKEHLLYEVCREVFGGFAERLVPFFAVEVNAVDRLRLLGREYVRWGLENSALYPVLFLGSPPAAIPPEEMQGDPGVVVLEGMVALIRAAMDEGELSDKHSPEAVAWAMWSAAHGLVLLLSTSAPWISEHLRVSDSTMVVPATDDLVEAVIDGLARAFAI